MTHRPAAINSTIQNAIIVWVPGRKVKEKFLEVRSARGVRARKESGPDDGETGREDKKRCRSRTKEDEKAVEPLNTIDFLGISIYLIISELFT